MQGSNRRSNPILSLKLLKIFVFRQKLEVWCFHFINSNSLSEEKTANVMLANTEKMAAITVIINSL